MRDHLDETGQPCKVHPPASQDMLLALAALGSRMPSFHHDAASKLQSLMMAIDEMSELAETLGDPNFGVAADTARAAVHELHALFTANRALGKPPQRAPSPLGVVFKRSAERAGVKLRGELTNAELEVALPAMTHALAVVLDVAAGTSHLGRTVDVVCVAEGKDFVIALTGPVGAAAKAPPNVGEVLAISAFLIARDGGELRCVKGGESFTVRLRGG
jgi:hypothetical protein